jgi:hypothetical protein
MRPWLVRLAFPVLLVTPFLGVVGPAKASPAVGCPPLNGTVYVSPTTVGGVTVVSVNATVNLSPCSVTLAGTFSISPGGLGGVCAPFTTLPNTAGGALSFSCDRGIGLAVAPFSTLTFYGTVIGLPAGPIQTVSCSTVVGSFPTACRF